ncbi:hypothetical protein [Paenibacillus sp. Soil766]|uniref:hypothetical protein n=1 Tax=Paenibacillus sp. Soil766 TaxID=1736404 RepID=UPI000B0E7E8C|nr:hypothetical protein [Paenibacillus sp. Soil766]
MGSGGWKSEKITCQDGKIIAGVMYPKSQEKTKQGFETYFGTNFVTIDYFYLSLSY